MAPPVRFAFRQEHTTEWHTALMTAAGPFATAWDGLEAEDRRSLLGHGSSTPVPGRLLLASLAATLRPREDAGRYYVAHRPSIAAR